MYAVLYMHIYPVFGNVHIVVNFKDVYHMLVL